MKQLFNLMIMVVLGAIILPLTAQEDPFIKDYIERLENSRKYVLLVAEMMPEDNYNFKATPESFSFAENLLHIGFAMHWHSQSLLGEKETMSWQNDTIYKVADKSKKEMMATVDKTFDAAISLMQQFDTAKMEDTLDYFGLNRSKRQIYMLLADHITHHRAQMLVSLRLNGLVPPRYVLFQ